MGNTIEAIDEKIIVLMSIYSFRSKGSIYYRQVVKEEELGYISRNLFPKPSVDSMQPITKLKRSFKGALMSVSDKLLLGKMGIVEIVKYELKNIVQVEYRHRCFDNFIINLHLLGTITAYCLFVHQYTKKIRHEDCFILNS